MSPSTPLLVAQGVHAHYGASHVLRGVDLAIATGESVGLLGRNGMGKTTLIRTLLGLHVASAGTVSLRGHDVTRAPAHRIARLGVGYVPEGRGIFPNLSVRENLMVAARPDVLGASAWTLGRVLAHFPRLDERQAHAGSALSGGEQQMLAIGRALMTNPALLVLDEATEGLAPLVVREIWAIIALVCATGIAALIVDRNFRAVLAHTQRVLVLEKGAVAATGPAAELAAAPATLTRLLGV